MMITNVDTLDKDVKLYNCGSRRLSHNIQTKLNMLPVNVYKHRKTGKTISVYVMTDELSEFLTTWSKNKPLKNKKGDDIV